MIIIPRHETIVEIVVKTANVLNSKFLFNMLIGTIPIPPIKKISPFKRVIGMTRGSFIKYAVRFARGIQDKANKAPMLEINQNTEDISLSFICSFWIIALPTPSSWKREA